jgi:two-component system cell cycle sensor histidine kinase/response regulator CckA
MRTILIVDDEPVVRNLLVSCIAAQGYRALEAVGRAEALELVRFYPETIHMAIIDQTLEDGNGLDLARELSGLQPGLRVLMTSGWLEETAMTGIQEGDTMGFLQKPFMPEVVLNRIREMLGREGTAGAGNT